MSKQVLVTGAGGFTGTAVVEELLRQGFSVIGLYRRNPPDLSPDLTRTVKLELLQADLTGGFHFPEGTDAVVHTAGQAAPAGRSVDDYLRDNVTATKNLVEESVRSGVAKIINFSSISVNGEVRVPVLDESTEIVDPSPYGISKYLAELTLREAESSVASVSIRLPGIMGRHSPRPWLARVFDKARKGQEIEIFNSGAPFNNLVHVDDIAHWVASLIERDFSDFSTVTVAAADPITVRETVGTVIELCGSSSGVSENTDSRSSFVISNETAMSGFGYTPSGVKKILERAAAEENQPLESVGRGER